MFMAVIKEHMLQIREPLNFNHCPQGVGLYPHYLQVIFKLKPSWNIWCRFTCQLVPRREGCHLAPYDSSLTVYQNAVVSCFSHMPQSPPSGINWLSRHTCSPMPSIQPRYTWLLLRTGCTSEFFPYCLVSKPDTTPIKLMT